MSHGVPPACTTLQPSAAQRVQHDARVVGVQQVVHRASCRRSSAASSSTRLEMLLEPGKAHGRRRPRSSGGMSRKAVVNMAGRRASLTSSCAHAASWRARVAGLVDACASSASPLPALDHGCSMACSAALEDLATGRAAPARLASRMSRHILRVAGGDAREVAKARAGQRRGSPCPAAGSRCALHQRERDQVRQVADRGEGGVVRFGRHLQHLAAQRLPHVGGALAAASAWVRSIGVRMTCLPAYRSASACSTPDDFLAGDRVAGHEGADVIAQVAAGWLRPHRAWSNPRP